MLEAILHPLINFVTATIGGYGAPAVFVLMLLESTGVLIPSEAISPFAGYLVSEGKMGFPTAVTAGVLGNLVGSWIAYAIGLWGGRELWLRYGKYVGVRAHHLATAEKWFDRHVSQPAERRRQQRPGERHHDQGNLPERRDVTFAEEP